MKEKILTEIRQALNGCADEKIRESSSRFFKEGEAPLVYGVGMKEVGKTAKAFCRQIAANSKTDIFEIADILLPDKDDMVQKGYDRLLKEASDTHQQEVFEYVMSKKAVMPRTALRYAIEKMPPELRAEVMKK